MHDMSKIEGQLMDLTHEKQVSIRDNTQLVHQNRNKIEQAIDRVLIKVAIERTEFPSLSSTYVNKSTVS